MQNRNSFGGTIQPKMGFELEIPVTFLTDKLENVDGKLAYLNGPHFKVVGDKSVAAGQMKGRVDDEDVTYSHTILEVVTHPIDEHAPGAETKMEAVLWAVESFQWHLNLATTFYKKQTTLQDLAKVSGLKMEVPDTGNYVINAPTATERMAPPETGYLHMTVGVTTSQIARAAEMVVNKGDQAYPGAATHQDGRTFISALVPFFQRTSLAFREKEKDYQPTDHAQMKNFLYLAYVHVRAIDRYHHPATQVAAGGTKKNYTPLLARATFYNMFKNLSEPAQKFIKAHDQELKKLIRDHLHTKEPVQEAQQYLDDIFSYQPISQQKYFGGMLEKFVEPTGSAESGAKGPPVEIRSLGTALDIGGIRDKVGEVFEASRTQFIDVSKPSPFSLNKNLVLNKS
jgi:hypothetical protein